MTKEELKEMIIKQAIINKIMIENIEIEGDEYENFHVKCNVLFEPVVDKIKIFNVE